MDWHWMSGWGWTVMVAGSVLWVALLVLAFRAIADWGLWRNERGAAVRESPREILDRRFAAGEIDLETYRQASDALDGHRSASP